MVKNNFVIFSFFASLILTLSFDVSHQKVGRLVGWLVFNGTFSTKRLYRAVQKLQVC